MISIMRFSLLATNPAGLALTTIRERQAQPLLFFAQISHWSMPSHRITNVLKYAQLSGTLDYFI